MFQSEYRQKNENSNFIADLGLTKGYKKNQKLTLKKKNSIGHLFCKIYIKIKFR